MTIIRLRGRRVVKGSAEAFAIVTTQPISFFGGVDFEKRGNN